MRSKNIQHHWPHHGPYHWKMTLALAGIIGLLLLPKVPARAVSYSETRPVEIFKAIEEVNRVIAPPLGALAESLLKSKERLEPLVQQYQAMSEEEQKGAYELKSKIEAALSETSLVLVDVMRDVIESSDVAETTLRRVRGQMEDYVASLNIRKDNLVHGMEFIREQMKYYGRELRHLAREIERERDKDRKRQLQVRFRREKRKYDSFELRARSQQNVHTIYGAGINKLVKANEMILQVYDAFLTNTETIAFLRTSLINLAEGRGFETEINAQVFTAFSLGENSLGSLVKKIDIIKETIPFVEALMVMLTSGVTPIDDMNTENMALISSTTGAIDDQLKKFRDFDEKKIDRQFTLPREGAKSTKKAPLAAPKVRAVAGRGLE